MRGLSKAALLLAPALAGGVALPVLRDYVSSALVIIQPPEPVDGVDDNGLSFRFDVLESADACEYANVTINGEGLPQSGRGTFSTTQGALFDANWNFSCVAGDDDGPKEQLVSLNVDAVDGQAVEDVALTIRFRQVAPVRISDVEGAVTIPRLHDIPSAQTGDHLDLEAELAELDFLKQQRAQVEQLISMKELYLEEDFGWSGNGHANCDSLQCLVKSLVDKASGAVDAIYEHLTGAPKGHHRPPHWRHPKFGWPGCERGNHTHGNHTVPHPSPLSPSPPPPPPLLEDEIERPIGLDLPLQPERPGRRPHHGGPGRQGGYHRQLSPPHQTPFTSLPHSLKIVASASLIVVLVALLHKCCGSHSSRAKYRAARQARREARRQRRAARQARRRAFVSRVKEIFAGFSLRRLLGYDDDDEKTATIRQPQPQPQPQLEPQPEPELEHGPDSDSDLSTTMEQEIAQFRAAASIVDDMVAAEEGRSRQRLRERYAVPLPLPLYHPPPPPPSPGAFADFIPDDESLPAYSEGRRSISAEESIVTDGFRYTPGSSSYTPSSSGTSTGVGADDVLGDTKY